MISRGEATADFERKKVFSPGSHMLSQTPAMCSSVLRPALCYLIDRLPDLLMCVLLPLFKREKRNSLKEVE